MNSTMKPRGEDRSTILSQRAFSPSASTWCRILLGLILVTAGLDRATAQMPRLENNPTLEGLRTATYSQPRQRLSAVKKLLDMGELSLVKEHLEQLMKEDLNDQQLATLHREFGTALFLQLSNEPELQPIGRQWATQVLDSASRLAKNPRQLAQWIQQLAHDERAAKRYAAIVELRTVGADAVEPLLSAMAKETDAQNLAWLRKGLTQLGSPAVEPLLATVTAQTSPPNAIVREQAMLALGRLGDQRAMAFLVRPYLLGNDGERAAAATALTALVGQAPSESLAIELLTDALRRWQKAYAARTLEELVVRETRLWHWWGAEGLRSTDYSLAEANALRIAQLTGDLYQLRPEDTRFRDDYLLAYLQASPLDNTLPSSKTSGIADKLLADLPATELDRLLSVALDRQQETAAVRLCERLGAVASPAMLLGTGNHRSPLARALRHPDRRVRFAAAGAITQIDPTSPFPGAADLIHTAEFFASAQGTHRVLIVHPRNDEAMAIAGWFENFGWDAETFTTPRQFLKTAQRHADYELLLISDRVYRPTAGELLQLVRRDPRTARTPVVMLASESQLARAERRAGGDKRTVVYPLPRSEETIRGLIQRTTQQRLASVLPVTERLGQAQGALEWFGRWSANRRRYHFYELLESQPVIRDALTVPALGSLAAKALGNLGTPDAQQALLDSASQFGQTLHLRQAAAEGFHRAVQRQGVQLTHSAILEQYARYNQSAHFDKATQTLLGQVLDTLEEPSRNKTPVKPAPATDEAEPPRPQAKQPAPTRLVREAT